MASRANTRLGAIDHEQLQGFYLDCLLELETSGLRVLVAPSSAIGAGGIVRDRAKTSFRAAIFGRELLLRHSQRPGG